MVEQNRAHERPVQRKKRSLANLAAFFLGLPLGLGILAAFHYYEPLVQSPAARYVRYPVEWAEVILFCCALAALLAKFMAQGRERTVFRRDLLPEWDGTPAPIADAGQMQIGLRYLDRRWQNTYLVRRVAALLEFVRHRNSTRDLDDQMRTLSDNDALAVEGSYSFIRFIIWAIPILGFLGTVLGITGAVTGLTPEVLEKELSKVTDGLALAFDTTALALGLTMILMFLQFLVERSEQGTLEAVDQYVDANLAHRFERSPLEDNGHARFVQQQTQQLLKGIEQLVQRQAELWAQTLDTADKHWAQQAASQQQQFNTALETALDRTLLKHTQRIGELQKALDCITEKATEQVRMMGQLQQNEAHLARMQDLLQKNLAALANSDTFHEAVQSLTAAIHLLTARTAPASVPMRQAKAA